jgi:hypothetical protein
MPSRNAVKRDIADPVLYRLYFGFMLPDIAHQVGLDATPYVQQRLHSMHKKYLKYPSTAGTSHKIMSDFLFEVGALWACFGIFVRTKEDQPRNILDLPLSECWQYL